MIDNNLWKIMFNFSLALTVITTFLINIRLCGIPKKSSWNSTINKNPINYAFHFAVREAIRTAAAIWRSYSQSLAEFTRTSHNNLFV